MIHALLFLKEIQVMRRSGDPADDHTPLGGNGMSSVLNGLKHYTRPSDSNTPAVDITAIVTVTDDGGSSGRLRREFDVLPPGDIRNCMVALSEDSALLSRLFQYRFQSGRGLKGHSFGNLFLMALTQYGRLPRRGKASEVLNIAGHIYPAPRQRRAGAKLVGSAWWANDDQPQQRASFDRLAAE